MSLTTRDTRFQHPVSYYCYHRCLYFLSLPQVNKCNGCHTENIQPWICSPTNALTKMYSRSNYWMAESTFFASYPHFLRHGPLTAKVWWYQYECMALLAVFCWKAPNRLVSCLTRLFKFNIIRKVWLTLFFLLQHYDAGQTGWLHGVWVF